MNRTAMMCLLLGLAASPPAEAGPVLSPESPAMAAEDLEATVKRAISGYEPNAARDLRGIADRNGAPAVSNVLLRLCRDGATPGILKLSAIESLGYVPTLAGRLYLHGLLTSLNQPTVAADDRAFTLAAVLRALGGFSATETTRISPFLQNGSADVREAAALSLARVGAQDADVLPLLQKRFALESDSGVKEALRNAILALQSKSR